MKLRNLLYIFFKDRPLIFTFFLAGIVLSFLYCFASPPMYKGEALILIFAPSVRPSPIEQYRPEVYRGEDRSRLIGDEIELLKRQHVTEEVVATLARKGIHPPADGSLWRRGADIVDEETGRLLFRLNLVPVLPDPERRTAERFLEALCVKPVKGTNLVSIAFYWTDPAFAAATANAYAEEYVARHNALRESEKAYRSYSDQAEALASKLKEMEGRLQQFTSDNEASAGSPQRALLLKSIADLTRRYEMASLDEARAQNWIARLKQAARKQDGWIETPASGLSLAGRQSYLKSLDDSYLALKGERDRLATLYSLDATEVRAIDIQIANLRTLKIQSLLAAANIDFSLADEKKATFAHRMDEEKKRLEDVGAAVATREELEQNKEAMEKEYRANVEKADELRASAELEAQALARIRVASLAVPPLEPASMRKELIVLFWAIAGLIVGFLLSVVRQSLRHIFRGASDVAGYLSVPLLLTVPFTRASLFDTSGAEGKKKRGKLETEPGRLRKLFGVDLRRPVAAPGTLVYGGAAAVVIFLAIAIGASGHLLHLRGAASTAQGKRTEPAVVSPPGPAERMEGSMPIEKELDRIRSEMADRNGSRTAQGIGPGERGF